MKEYKLHSLTAYTTDGVTEKIEFDADAFVTVDERYTTLEYVEPPQEGCDAVMTRLTVHNDGSVTIVRSAFSTERQIMGITMKLGERNTFLYNSDYGAMEMVCIPKVIAPKLDGCTGMIALRYDLDFGGDKVEYNMLITVESKQG